MHGGLSGTVPTPNRAVNQGVSLPPGKPYSASGWRGCTLGSGHPAMGRPDPDLWMKDLSTCPDSALIQRKRKCACYHHGNI